MITRDQFIRGFDAIKTHHASRRSIEDAALAAGWDEFNIGYDPIARELQRQLEERCGDTTDDPHFGTEISYALNEKGRCSTADGLISMTVDSAEALWTWWERTKTGPFLQPTAEVVSLDDHRRPK